MTEVADHVRATFACGQCGAGLAFEGARTETCPYCASPNLIDRPPSFDRPTPLFVLGFAVDAATARQRLDAWLGARSAFVDSALRRARVEDLRGVYLPAYVYSAAAQTSYTAQIGEDYFETETYDEQDANGETVTREVKVRKTEYCWISGCHATHLTDLVVSASVGISNDQLARVAPFDLRWLRRYTPALIAGWTTEEFTRDPAECWRLAHAAADADLRRRLRAFMPGDSCPDLQSSTRTEWESLEPMLAPVWVLAIRYRDDKPPMRVIINGQTGTVHGEVPLSGWKIARTIAGLAAVALALLLWRALR